MKPWYDNYCFSEEALETQSRVFNSDMVIYYLRNMVQTGEPPKQMLDPNTKTDYNKMKRLLQLDRLDTDRLEDGFYDMAYDGKWRDALQFLADSYAKAPRVEALRQGTRLHKIIMQFEGWQLKRMEEV